MEPALIWGLGLLGIGLVVIIIEMFVVTFGVLTLVAAGCGIAGVILLFNHSTSWGLVGATLVAIGGPTIFFFGLQIMPKTAIGKRLVLGNPGDHEDADGGLPARKPDPYAELVGREGVVVSDLRPVGIVLIGDERLEALAESTVLPAGTRVRVVAVVDGHTLKVRATA
jgi:membrane-bound serine protease (ClpP class)